MIVRFFRRRFIEASITGKAGETPLLRIFELTLGLEAPVDPLSGMTVNLTKVDAWIADLPVKGEFANEWICLEGLRRLLATQVQQGRAKIVSLELKEDRQWWALTERGAEKGERQLSRKKTNDGSSYPVWQETVRSQAGEIIETREISFDGSKSESYLPVL